MVQCANNYIVLCLTLLSPQIDSTTPPCTGVYHDKKVLSLACQHRNSAVQSCALSVQAYYIIRFNIAVGVWQSFRKHWTSSPLTLRHDLHLLKHVAMFQYIHENLLIIVLMGFLVWIFLKWKRSPQWRLPPGPPGWPILGNLPILFQSPGFSNDRYYYTQCANKYGDIYKLQLGPQMMYVLCNIDYIRAVFTHSDVQGRLSGAAYTKVFGPAAKGKPTN